MRRIDKCWMCEKENIECDITVLKSGEEMAVCDECYEDEKRNAEYVDPMDLI